MSGQIDYRRLNSHELLSALGDDAAKWAEAFKQHFPDETPDEGTLIGWFANAIEHSSDVRRWRRERVARENRPIWRAIWARLRAA